MKSAFLLLLLVAQSLSYDVTKAIQFANANWNCVTAACTSRVSAGTFQSQYQCAEFVARSIAAGGAIPNLGPQDAQSKYLTYKYNGKTYDLLWVSHAQGGPLGLEDWLIAAGWKNIGSDCSKVTAGAIEITNGSGGPKSHVVFGVGTKTVDSHNSARLQVNSCFYTSNAIYVAPGSSAPPTPPPAGCKGKYTVNTDDVNFRASASLSGTVIDQLSKGDTAYDLDGTTTAASGYNWRHVASGSKTGYVADNYLTSAGACPVTAQKYCITAQPALNLRSTACTTGSVVAAMPEGHFATDLGLAGTSCGHTWRHLTYNGLTGYAADDYLTPCTPAGQYNANDTNVDLNLNCTAPEFPPNLDDALGVLPPSTGAICGVLVSVLMIAFAFVF